MYACPNCGRNIKFDIASQSLLCDACSSSFSPYDVVKNEDAAKDTYQTNVYTCPSCGGEIRTEEDNVATAVCMYCGGSNVLTERISDEKKVDYIIPFKVTKEECNRIYAKKLKRNIFAPSEIRRKIKADSFRGIYMPYWIYSITQKGDISLDAKRDYREGSNSVSETYKIEGKIDASYAGVSYDASSSFPDNMSQVIAPYDIAGLKEFTPSYLSGFYADASDTQSDIYYDEAMELVSETTLKKISDKISPAKLDIAEGTVVREALKSKCDEYRSAMFPVWFMSFKHRGRMSYSVVNGQTGDIYADVPISIWKYLLGSLIIFIPFFLLLNLFTLTPQLLCFLTGIFAFITILIFNKESKTLYCKEQNLDDRGYCYHNGMPLPECKRNLDKEKKNNIKTTLGAILSVVVLGILYLGGVVLGLIYVLFYSLYATRLYGFIFPTLAVIFYVMGQIQYSKYKKGIAPTLISAIVSVITGFFILFNPVYDVWYYAAAIVGILSVIFNVICLVNVFNKLSTRPMPQFKRSGGDDDAV